MKQNIIFFAVLSILLGVAYYFEELGEVRVRQQEKTAGRIISEKEWSQTMFISTPYARRPLGESAFEDIAKALNNLQIERRIPHGHITQNNWSSYFSNKLEKFVLEFAAGKKEILIGRKLNFNQNFYVEVVTGTKDTAEKIEHFIVKDLSIEPGFYNRKTVYRSPAKYNRLKKLLYIKG